MHVHNYFEMTHSKTRRINHYDHYVKVSALLNCFLCCSFRVSSVKSDEIVLTSTQNSWDIYHLQKLDIGKITISRFLLYFMTVNTLTRA